MSRSRAAVALMVGVLAAATAALGTRPARVVVEPGGSLQAVVDDAAPGTIVVLAPGIHRGPVRMARPVDLRGEPGATIVTPASADAGVVVAASDSRISGLRVQGASTGILVREVTGVVIDGVEVSGSDLHGIEIVDGSVHVFASTVDDLRHPMAQGIEIRNSDGRPDSFFERIRVTGGQEGIVSHVSEVVIRDSVVTDTTMRGIAVTEMSDGVVSGNTVAAAAGSGLFCGDMSRCAFDNNVATGVAAGGGGRSNAGWGLVVAYHSMAWSNDNELSGDSGALLTTMDSHMTARSPLDPGSLADIVAPVSLAALIAVVLGGLGYVAAPLLGARRADPGRRGRVRAGLLAVFLVALGVQSFHMFEHWLQVYRVHVDLVPSRGGLIGPAVQSEWVHLVYNGAVMAFLAVTFGEIRRAAFDARAQLLGAAVLVQGWHMVEHIVKVAQHVTTGSPVNPGVLGAFSNLIWFHFTVNLTVYGLCVAAALAWLVRERRAPDPVVADPVPA